MLFCDLSVFRSVQGYRYMQYFGIDVWNLSTGTSKEILPFAHYGQLLQMDTSSDGQQMVLLLCSRDDNYLCVINVNASKIETMISHPGCESFTVSHDREFIATVARTVTGSHEIKLWSYEGLELECEKDASCPLFTFNNAMLVCISSDSMTLVTFNLTHFTRDQVAGNYKYSRTLNNSQPLNKSHCTTTQPVV